MYMNNADLLFYFNFMYYIIIDNEVSDNIEML